MFLNRLIEERAHVADAHTRESIGPGIRKPPCPSIWFACVSATRFLPISVMRPPRMTTTAFGRARDRSGEMTVTFFITVPSSMIFGLAVLAFRKGVETTDKT